MPFRALLIWLAVVVAATGAYGADKPHSRPLRRSAAGGGGGSVWARLGFPVPPRTPALLFTRDGRTLTHTVNKAESSNIGTRRTAKNARRSPCRVHLESRTAPFASTDALNAGGGRRGRPRRLGSRYRSSVISARRRSRWNGRLLAGWGDLATAGSNQQLCFMGRAYRQEAAHRRREVRCFRAFFSPDGARLAVLVK